MEIGEVRGIKKLGVFGAWVRRLQGEKGLRLLLLPVGSKLSSGTGFGG